MRTSLPQPRGPISSAFVAGARHGCWAEPDLASVDPLVDDDLHLALWCAYQLHYGGFHDLDDDLEWDPATLGFRGRLEAAFEAALRAEHRPEQLPEEPTMALRVIAEWSAPPLSRWIAAEGQREHLAEYAVHRSAYQLKEADGHTWMIPRLSGRAKAAVVEIQVDEYGGGRAEAAHATLFAAAMDELGLDPTFGRYVPELPGTTLATDNLLSMFGLHGRLRGALVGHLAHFEMCSPIPMARYRQAAARLGLRRFEHFCAVHAEVDLHHARLALDEAVRPISLEEPALAPEITFGAAALHRVEARFARRLLTSWTGAGPTSPAVPAAASAPDGGR